MTETISITCPYCGHTYPLADLLLQPALKAAVEARVKEEQEQLIQDTAQKTEERLMPHIAKAELEAADLRIRLAEAETAELEARRQRRILNDERNRLELSVERQVEAQCQSIREAARRERDEIYQLSLAQRDKIIGDMREQIEELRRRAEHESAQLKGEVLELKLEEQLKQAFPGDVIEEVPKGHRGADILHHVLGPTGKRFGVIMYESKNTAKWSAEWLLKCREDMRRCEAQVAVLISRALPPEVGTFERIGGVWVAGTSCALPLARALRAGVLAVGMARLSVKGRESKAEHLWGYITSDGFKDRISCIVEGCVSLHEALDSEKRFLTRNWTKQGKHVEKLFTATGELWGDLQALAGNSLPQIEGLTVDEPEPDGTLEDQRSKDEEIDPDRRGGADPV